MKRSWIILIETMLSILLLVSFYLYMINSINRMAIKENSIDIEKYRQVNESCDLFPDLSYGIYDFNKTVFCDHGRKVNITEGQPIFVYLYAGYKRYSPRIVEIFS